MKARTAKERAVEALTAQYIRPLTDEQIRAAHGVARPKSYVLCPGNTKDKGLVWCTNCGHVINFRPAPLVNQGARCVCDNCGATLTGTNEAVYSNHGHLSHDDSALVALAEVVGEWQVFRYFYIASTSRLGQRAWLSRPTEVVRRWYNVVHGGKEVVWSVGITGMMYANWNFNAPLSLKYENTRPTYYGTISYKFIPDAWIPGGTWHKALKRDGCKGETTARRLDLAPHEIVPAFTCPQIVTLVKGHHYKMARYYSGGVGNGFLELREDTTSPHWICPENLRLAHDRSNTRVLRLRRLKEIEREKKLAADEEADYAKRIRPFRDLRIQGAGVVISVIPSVEDVRQEGHAMHHCVFTMRYYKQESTLLLSARDEGGQRLETIEFDLARGEVVQSRAVCNGTSKKHSQILKMMKGAADEIITAWKRARSTRPDNRLKSVQELTRAFV